MDDDKKKKKNKKKRNKQSSTKIAEDVASGAGSSDQKNHLTNGQTCENEISDADKDLEVDQNKLHSNGVETVNLEEVVRQLRHENDANKEKVANLEEVIRQLRHENDLHREEESYSKETIAKMDVDIKRLQLQVSELEESNNSVLQENQSLQNYIFDLQARIQHLEKGISSAHHLYEERKCSSEYGESNAELEAARALVEKLVPENADLVEKVNELYLQLNQQKLSPGVSLPIPTGSTVEIADSSSISNKNLPDLDLGQESLEFIQVGDGRNGKDNVEKEHGLVTSSSQKSDEFAEIVQIPLDENEVDLDLQGVESEQKDVVPLSEAPLIGAPFRLISFFASYVSGADLVEKNVDSRR